MTNDLEDYLKYRGRCKELSGELVAGDPTLRLVRGYYYCPYWGQQKHWWTEKEGGSIIDPTKDQFPSKGSGRYVEFDGVIICEVCSKEIEERDAYIVGNHAYCSYSCYGVDVM